MPSKGRAFVDFQAVIIVGPGHQLHPLIDTHSPKCFLPIGNKPMIVHVLTWLTSSGISTSLVLCNPKLAGSLSAAVSKYCDPRTQIGIIPFIEDDVGGSGTVAALLAARPYIKNDFILLPCDLVTNVPLQVMADLHRSKEALATCMLCSTSEESASSASTCFVGMDGQRVVYLRRSDTLDRHSLTLPLPLLYRHPCLNLRTDLQDTHCYMFSRDIYEHPILQTGKGMFSIKEELMPALVKSVPVYAYILEQKQQPPGEVADGRGEYCLRANNKDALMQANRLLALHLAPSKKDPTLMGENGSQGERSTIRRSNIGHHVTIGRNVRIANCLIMDHVVIQDNCKLDNVIAGAKSTIRDACQLKDSAVGPQYVVERGTVSMGESFSVGDVAF